MSDISTIHDNEPTNPKHTHLLLSPFCYLSTLMFLLMLANHLHDDTSFHDTFSVYRLICVYVLCPTTAFSPFTLTSPIYLSLFLLPSAYFGIGVSCIPFFFLFSFLSLLVLVFGLDRWSERTDEQTNRQTDKQRHQQMHGTRRNGYLITFWEAETLFYHKKILAGFLFVTFLLLDTNQIDLGNTSLFSVELNFIPRKAMCNAPRIEEADGTASKLCSCPSLSDISIIYSLCSQFVYVSPGC